MFKRRRGKVPLVMLYIATIIGLQASRTEQAPIIRPVLDGIQDKGGTRRCYSSLQRAGMVVLKFDQLTQAACTRLHQRLASALEELFFETTIGRRYKSLQLANKLPIKVHIVSTIDCRHLGAERTPNVTFFIGQTDSRIQFHRIPISEFRSGVLHYYDLSSALKSLSTEQKAHALGLTTASVTIAAAKNIDILEDDEDEECDDSSGEGSGGQERIDTFNPAGQVPTTPSRHYVRICPEDTTLSFEEKVKLFQQQTDCQFEEGKDCDQYVKCIWKEVTTPLATPTVTSTTRGVPTVPGTTTEHQWRQTPPAEDKSTRQSSTSRLDSSKIVLLCILAVVSAFLGLALVLLLVRMKRDSGECTFAFTKKMRPVEV